MSYRGSSGSALVIRHTGQVFPLTEAPVAIGRSSDNDIVLSDQQVSRHHATIFWKGGTYYVQDLGSANGTYLNEQPVTQPQPLRHGYVIRVGNTIFDAKLAAAPGPTMHAPASPAGYEPEEEEPGRSSAPIIIGLLIGAIVVVGVAIAAILMLAGGGRSKPTVTIQSPLAGSQVAAGTEIVLQATATGARNITRLEISVDGALVEFVTSSDPSGQASLTAAKPWTFGQAGPHVVSAVAFTARGRTSDPVSANVAVAGAVAQETPSTTPETPAPTMTASTTPLPTVEPPSPEPSDTVEPEVPTDTPTPTTTPTNTPTPTPTNTNTPPPQIAFFQANPASITAGGCTTLEWGAVSNATEASIDQGIGGIATPGSRNVCPTETTTYVLTATGPGGTSTASTTVTVSAAQPDLIVQSIAFAPNPPVQNHDNEVRVTIRNIGTADAGAFDWAWQPGADAPLTGNVAGLHAGETILVTKIWHPTSSYASLATVARADTGNSVAESNDGNNELAVNTAVVAPSEVTITRSSQADLDGFRSNNNGGNNSVDVRVGNGAFVGSPSYELVTRGFMSFDLSGIPAGATVQSIDLRFFQVQVVGDPYGKLGNPLLKHVDYGSSLEGADYDTAPFDSAILAAHSSPGEWYTITSGTIGSWIEQDLAAGRTRLQLRLQFTTETDADGNEDTISIEAGDNSFGTGNIPELTITYTP